MFSRKDLTMPFEVGDKVILKIDPHKRFQMMINHTAAHILNAAIKEVFPISHYKNGYVDDQMIVSNFSVYGYCYNNEGKCHDSLTELLRVKIC